MLLEMFVNVSSGLLRRVYFLNKIHVLKDPGDVVGGKLTVFVIGNTIVTHYSDRFIDAPDQRRVGGQTGGVIELVLIVVR